MSNETKEVAVLESSMTVYGQSPEQLRKSLELVAERRDIVKEVISKILQPDDVYRMSDLRTFKSDAEHQDARAKEKDILKKSAVDKIISFFKIKTYPTTTKIDGGYEVTIIGKDYNDNYINSGTGICTVHEKKYQWVKAEDIEYDEASPENRRELVRGYGTKTYKTKQIKTDERAIAHTLISMATKRAEAAFLRKAFAGMFEEEISFEGEESQVDYNAEDDNRKILTDTERQSLNASLLKKVSKEELKAITDNLELPKPLTQEGAEILKNAVNDYLARKTTAPQEEPVEEPKPKVKYMTKNDITALVERGKAAGLSTKGWLKSEMTESEYTDLLSTVIEAENEKKE